MPHCPPSRGDAPAFSTHPYTPHRKKPGQRGTWAALSNLTVAEVQKENSPSRCARRYWCQMSEESSVCHIERVALEKPVAWGRGGQRARLKSRGVGGGEAREQRFSLFWKRVQLCERSWRVCHEGRPGEPEGVVLGLRVASELEPLIWKSSSSHHPAGVSWAPSPPTCSPFLPAPQTPDPSTGSVSTTGPRAPRVSWAGNTENKGP